jgi:serine/threonine-protein kinase
MTTVIGSESVLRREGLVRILYETNVDVVGFAASVEDLVGEVLAHNPDFAIVDLQTRSGELSAGIAAATAIRAEAPDVAVFVLTEKIESAQLSQLLTEGSAGIGCLLTDQIEDLPQFLNDVRRVAEGGSAINPAFLVAAGRPTDPNPLDRLSNREREALSLLAAGRDNDAIAKAMTITKKSAEQHVARAYDKLDLDRSKGIHQRVSAALLYREHCAA